MDSHRVNTILLGLVVLLFSITPCEAQQPSSISQPGSAKSLGRESLLAPEDLVKILRSGGPKPLILNVGPRMLYMQARIPGAEFIGPGSDPQSIEGLKQRVKKVSKAANIVLYCGCCPWEHCPNVAPAYDQLRSLGFKRVKVLYLATNLGVDWVYKGYPTER